MMAQREATTSVRARGVVNPCITRNVGTNRRAPGKNSTGVGRRLRRSFARTKGAARDSIAPGTKKAGPHIVLLLFVHHHERGCPTLRDFRRVGTSDDSVKGFADLTPFSFTQR